MPTHEFHSLFQKMNNEQRFIFDNVMYRRKKQNPNEPIHLFIIRGVGTCKNFTLMFLIKILICFYNKHPHLNHLKKNICSWHILEKQHLTLMELQFIQVFLYHLIVKIYHH
jgi:hypothetical protein